MKKKEKGQDPFGRKDQTKKLNPRKDNFFSKYSKFKISCICVARCHTHLWKLQQLS